MQKKMHFPQLFTLICKIILYTAWWFDKVIILTMEKKNDDF